MCLGCGLSRYTIVVDRILDPDTGGKHTRLANFFHGSEGITPSCIFVMEILVEEKKRTFSTIALFLKSSERTSVMFPKSRTRRIFIG